MGGGLSLRAAEDGIVQEQDAGTAGGAPAPLTPLVGRAVEVASVGALLESPAVRLVTLTGPGGTGKTRLALHLAAEVLDRFPGGTYFVELAAVERAALVPSAIARALGVEERSGRSLLDSLKATLAQRRLLLVLDNCEHVLEAASTVAELLAACPRVKALATSREPLRISGEREFSVPPLAVPDLEPSAPTAGGLDVHALGLCDSVVLFVARALGVRSDFALTPETAPSVAEICVRLDGLPLAIELAAARLKVLTPQELNRRLTESQLRLLTGGARDLPERQRTLRAAIDWSYALLALPEQTLHRRLAVFAGGATLDATESVCNAASLLPIDLLDGLASLVDKSLVRQREEDGGHSRFSMLQTIREYALERLETSGEAPAVRRSHLEYFLALARARPASGAAFPAWYARLEREQDNLRGAMEWALAHSEGELALRLASALTDFWRQRGHLEEGRRWLEAALAASAGTAPPEARIWALHGTGLLAHLQGDNAPARAHWEESLALARANGDRMAMAWMLNGLAGIARSEGDLDSAQTRWEESLALCRELGNQGGTAHALTGLGMVARRRGDLVAARDRYEESLALLRHTGQAADSTLVLSEAGAVAVDLGDFAAARALWEEALALARKTDHREGVAASLLRLGYLQVAQGDVAAGQPLIEEGLAIHREAGNRWEIAKGLGFLGDSAHAAGNRAAARQLYEESLALCRELGDLTGAASALADLGNLAQEAGDTRRAATHYAESLAIRRELGDRIGLAESLEDFAGLAAAHGRHTEALQLAGAAAGLRDETGARPTPLARDRLEHQLAPARQALGHRAGVEATGRAIALDAACEAALASAARLQPDGPNGAATGQDAAAITSSPASEPGRAQGSAPRAPDAWPEAPYLTPREREVVLLIARGISNREIAAALVITEKTAATHVDRILGKLGLRRRGQITAWLMEHAPGAARLGAGAE